MDPEGLADTAADTKEECPSLWQIEACSTFAYNELMFSFRNSDLKPDMASGSSEVEKMTSSRPLKITDLPPEILEFIFRKMSYDTVGKIRLVCQYFNTVTSSLLNSEFNRLRFYTHNRFQSIKALMPRRESARRKHPLARESDIIETLHMRLTLLHMTFGKHIKRKHCCFFAGGILDEVYRIINYTKVTPSLNKAYKVTDELFDLSTMAMEYFKENIEPSLPEITYFAADFLEYAPTISPLSKLSLLEDSVSCTSNTFSKSSNSTANSSTSSLPKENYTVSKRIRKLHDVVKKNNGHVIVVKRDLKVTKKKVLVQEKQIEDLKSRQDDNDRKFQNLSRKLSAVLQELNRCKTELQYWRSKSPAALCSCGKATPGLEVLDVDYPQPLLDFLPSDHDDPTEEFKPISPKLESLPSCSNYMVTVPHGNETTIKPHPRLSPLLFKYRKVCNVKLNNSSKSRKRRIALAEDSSFSLEKKKILKVDSKKVVKSKSLGLQLNLDDNTNVLPSSSSVENSPQASCSKHNESFGFKSIPEDRKDLPDDESLLMEILDTNSMHSSISSNGFSSFGGTDDEDEEFISSDESDCTLVEYPRNEQLPEPLLNVNATGAASCSGSNSSAVIAQEDNQNEVNHLDTQAAPTDYIGDPHARQIIAVKNFLSSEIKTGSNLQTFRSDILHLKQHLAQQAHKLQMDIECAKND